MNPFLTKLSLGHKCVDGLGMSLHQAAIEFKGWLEQKPEATDELRTYVLAKLRNEADKK